MAVAKEIKRILLWWQFFRAEEHFHIKRTTKNSFVFFLGGQHCFGKSLLQHHSTLATGQQHAPTVAPRNSRKSQVLAPCLLVTNLMWHLQCDKPTVHLPNFASFFQTLRLGFLQDEYVR